MARRTAVGGLASSRRIWLFVVVAVVAGLATQASAQAACNVSVTVTDGNHHDWDHCTELLDVTVDTAFNGLLTGLYSLERVYGHLTVDNVAALTGIDTFYNLTRVDGDLAISRLSGVTSLHGFDQLTHIDTLTIQITGITAVSGFNNLTTAAKVEILSHTAVGSMVSISGFSKVVGVTSIDIRGNDNLLTLTAFANLVHAGTVTFSYNAAFVGPLSAFSSLETATSVVIEENDAIVSFSMPSLVNVTSTGIDDAFKVYDNDVMTSFTVPRLFRVESASGVAFHVENQHDLNFNLVDFRNLTLTIGDFFVGPAVTAGPPWYTLSLPSLTTITGDVDLYGLLAVDDVDLCNLDPPGGTRNFIGWTPMACASLEAFLPLPWGASFCDAGGTFVDFCAADCAGVVRGLALNDTCDVCYGGTTGVPINSTLDCNGVCSGASFVCNSTCIDPAAPPLDLCNGWDDDCNNATLDGAGEPWFHTLCDGVDADLCDEGVWECVGAAMTCNDTNTVNLELCNGINDDCDASTAEGVDELGGTCDGPDADACSTGLITACVGGVLTCNETGLGFAEECGSGDDDCDGLVDEGLSCASGVVLRVVPDVVDAGGGTVIELALANFDLASTTVLFDGEQMLNLSWAVVTAADGTDEQVCSFEAPPSGSRGYKVLRVADSDDVGTELVYAGSSCIAAGTFEVNGQCVACPPSATCPGGGRVWPLDGYWNTNETDPRVYQCLYPPSRCGGTAGSSICGEGYAADRCGVCAEGYYHRLDGCAKCASEAIGITLVAINGLFLAALVVAFLYLNDTRLTTAITAITAVQVVRIVSQLASSRLPDAAQDILQVLSLVMLDFKFIRPGCVVGESNFMSILVGTIALVFLVAAPTLGILSLVRCCTKGETTVWYANRTPRAAFITMEMTYFILCTRAVESLRCHKEHGTYYLLAEPSLLCFSPEHTAAAAIGAVLALYVLVVPFFVLYLSRKLHTTTDKHERSRYGYLFEMYRPERYWWVFVEYVFVFLVATSYGVFKNSPLAQLITTGGAFLCFLVLNFVAKPFATAWRNASKTASSFVGMTGTTMSLLSSWDLNLPTTLAIPALIAFVFIFLLSYSSAAAVSRIRGREEDEVAPFSAYSLYGSSSTGRSSVSELLLDSREDGLDLSSFSANDASESGDDDGVALETAEATDTTAKPAFVPFHNISLSLSSGSSLDLSSDPPSLNTSQDPLMGGTYPSPGLPVDSTFTGRSSRPQRNSTRRRMTTRRSATGRHGVSLQSKASASLRISLGASAPGFIGDAGGENDLDSSTVATPSTAGRPPVAPSSSGAASNRSVVSGRRISQRMSRRSLAAASYRSSVSLRTSDTSLVVGKSRAAAAAAAMAGSTGRSESVKDMMPESDLGDLGDVQNLLASKLWA